MIDTLFYRADSSKVEDGYGNCTKKQATSCEAGNKMNQNSGMEKNDVYTCIHLTDRHQSHTFHRGAEIGFANALTRDAR